MGLFGKLRGDRPVASAPTVVVDAVCVHATLAPRWENAAELGHEDKISGYRCDACHSVFTHEEGKVLRATEAERLKSTIWGH